MTYKQQGLKFTNECESPLEEKLLSIIEDYEIYSMVKGFYQQVWVYGYKYRVDFLFHISDYVSLVVEVDGKAHFNIEESGMHSYTEKDMVRQRNIEKLGWVFLRIPYWELRTPELVANRLEACIESLK